MKAGNFDHLPLSDYEAIALIGLNRRRVIQVLRHREYWEETATHVFESRLNRRTSSTIDLSGDAASFWSDGEINDCVKAFASEEGLSSFEAIGILTGKFPWTISEEEVEAVDEDPSPIKWESPGLIGRIKTTWIVSLNIGSHVHGGYRIAINPVIDRRLSDENKLPCNSIGYTDSGNVTGLISLKKVQGRAEDFVAEKGLDAKIPAYQENT